MLGHSTGPHTFTSLVTKPGDATSQAPKPVNGHDPEPVPSTSYPRYLRL
jgi:hypothetical protein